jgi:hypothetical protein
MYSLVLKQAVELPAIPTLSGFLLVYFYDSPNMALSSPNYMMWNDKATNEKSV